MDKVNKRFQDFFASKTFQVTVLAVTSFFTFLLTNLPTIAVL